ncbi:hypothetical protein [Marivirga sp.]|uniref:hypothetical protein n=1 Tax=Marivirga sp. TaxID=2018662 RepID=UPI002D7FF8F7|nr:hypothetical protein [Marivirga sp.]HET8860792.1 hypothetical protein [Marivirga sp.]
MAPEINLVVIDKSPSSYGYAEGSTNSVVEDNMNIVNQLYEKYPQNLNVVNHRGQSIEPYQEINVNEASSQLNLKNIVKRNASSEKVLILSDFQKQVIDENVDLLSDSAFAFVLMPPHQSSPDNVWVDSLWLTQEGNSGENLLLQVQLSSTGNNDNVNVALENANQLIGTQQIELVGGNYKKIEFPIARFLENENRSYQLVIDGDAVEFDNEFYFEVPSQRRLKILSLSNERENLLMRTVFENEKLFEFKSESYNNFSFQDLDEYDFVLLQIGQELSSFASSALKTYATSGNSLLIIPEDDFVQTSLLEDLGFANVRRISRDNSSPIKLENPDIQNPFFSNVFSSMDSKMTMPESKLFLRWESGQSLLSLVNGYPFLSVTGINSNVYAFSVPLSNEFTNFPQHGLFLPTLYKMAFSGRKENQLQYAYLNQEIVTLNFENGPNSSVYKLKQGEQELVPDQRMSGNKLRLILPDESIKAGFYDLIDTKTEEKIMSVALNFPKVESENSFYTTSELQDLFQDERNIQVLEEYDFSSIDNYIAETKKGFPLWKYFLVLALLSLLAEVLIIRFLK